MRRQSPATWLSSWSLALALLGVGPAWGQQAPGAGASPDAVAAAAANVPGSEPDALARYVPAKDVIFYVEFQGFEAYPDAWHQTAAYKILSDTKTGAMLGEVFTQIIDQGLAPLPGGKLSGADATALAEHALNAGFVLASYGSPEKPDGVLVLRDAFREDIRPVLARFLGTSGVAGAGLQVTSKPGGRRVASKKERPNAGWWVEKNRDLVLASQVDPVIAAIDGEANALTNPNRQELAKSDGAFQPVGLAFLALPPDRLPPSAATLGLDGLKKLDYRWGFEGESLRSELRVVAPAPRKGLLTLLDQPTFGLDDVPPLPEGIEEFAVISLDLDKSYGALTDLVNSIGGPESEAAKELQQFEKAVHDKTRKDLREDILSQIGPKVTYYTLPSTKSGVGSALDAMNPLAGLQVPKFVLAIEVKDAKKFGATVAELMGVLNRQIEEAVSPPKDKDEEKKSRGGAAAGRVEFETVGGGGRVPDDLRRSAHLAALAPDPACRLDEPAADRRRSAKST